MYDDMCLVAPVYIIYVLYLCCFDADVWYMTYDDMNELYDDNDVVKWWRYGDVWKILKFP